MGAEEADLAALDLLETVTDTTEPHIVRHFLYADGATDIEKLVLELRAQRFEVFESAAAADSKRLVLAIHTIIPGEEAMSAARTTMENLAERFCAEYDGWEVESGP